MSTVAAHRRVNWSALTDTHARQRPNKAALRFRDRTWTWREMDGRVSRLANWLTAAGLGAGDRVAILAMNTPEVVEIVVAAERIGAIAVPLNFRLTGGELAFILEDCTPAVVLTDEALLPNLAASGYETTWTLLVGGAASGDNIVAYEDALAESPPEAELADVDDNAVAWIMYTSGTTGRPKGAMLTHLNLFLQGFQGIRDFRLTSEEIALHTVPLFHIAGLGAMVPTFVLGSTAVLQPTGAFDAAKLLDIVERERVTNMFLVPAQWQAMVAQPDIHERDLALRSISWGAAPASQTLLQAMAEAFPNVRNVAVFGQTEMSPVTCSLMAEDAQRKVGSVGKPIPTIQMRIVDPAGNDVPQGEVGEAVYRGPTTMAGYWNRPDADVEAFPDGWFHSGDLVRADEEGFVYVVDRLKDMIISGGENIFCAEVENILAAHPAIVEAAFVGRPSEKWGEEPVAFLVIRPGERAPTLDELSDWLADRLARYKHPKAIAIIDELPRNASGKVIKPPLRERAAANAPG